MKVVKVCMECGSEFEDDIRFNNILSCPTCGSGDIYQPKELEYNDLTLEECFMLYHNDKIACECCGDKREVNFIDENTINNIFKNNRKF